MSVAISPLVGCPKPLLVNVLAATATAVLLAGCGGGGSGPAPAPAPAAVSQAPAPSLVPSNKAPVGDAGTALVARVGTATQLDGSASKDDDGDTLSYAWTLTTKPAASNVSLTDSTSAKPSLTPDVPGTYVATLVVSDGKAGSQAVTVKVLAEAVAFDSTPNPMPPNMSSYGFEANSLASLGDKVGLAGTARLLRGVTVAMSSWACENGGWNGTCTTTPNATFEHPVTIRLFDTGGTLLATKTQTFKMPYRPSSDPACGTAWKAANGTCYNGFAFKLDFDLSSLEVTLPDTVVYEVAYNTQHYGAVPVGVTGPYDSLNVGAYKTTAAPSVGSDVDPGSNRQNGATKADTYSPMVQIVVTDTP